MNGKRVFSSLAARRLDIARIYVELVGRQLVVTEDFAAVEGIDT